ncbi:MAG TPA: hypothetical protein DCG63_12905, partial [Methylophilaceae bacterium]|nr:hypothetical protein [Methylophilaceae bacterium]
MFFNKKSSVANGRIQAEPSAKEKHGAHLVREAWWLGLVLVGVYLAVILITYSKQDQSWSR